MPAQGKLTDMSLTSLISVNCNELSQDRLLVRHEGQEGAVFFEDGNIVHVAVGFLEGEEALYELLAWEDGEFELEQGVNSPRRTVTSDWSGLLLEGMRRIDESTAGFEIEWDTAAAEDGTGEKKAREETAKRMTKDLRRIDGIQTALLCSAEGEVLGEDSSSKPVKEATFTAFVGHRAETVSTILGIGELVQVVLLGEEQRTMIIPYEQNYLNLSILRRTSESVTKTIRTTLRRYRQTTT